MVTERGVWMMGRTDESPKVFFIHPLTDIANPK